MSVGRLNPTKLGTKEHWGAVYNDEVANFEEIGDEGEIWFGTDSVEKMVAWALQNTPPDANHSILEIGTGNGTLLFALAEAGYTAERLCGIDYIPDAIKLSQSIASSRGITGITFHVGDFLKEDPPMLSHSEQGHSQGASWDILLDKGTYDAIALMGLDENGQAPEATYPAHVEKLLKPGGLFLITSCNFTEGELQAIFATSETGLLYHSRIQHQTFTYGGITGSICSSIAFQKPK